MILSLKNISKSFGTIEVLKDINIDLQEGEILTILGASGSGKSTILNLIAGFEEPDSGSISTYENIVSSSDKFVEPHKRNVGFVFQNYALFPHLNVFKNIAFGISNKDINIQKSTVAKMMKLTGLDGLELRYPHELSGGQQQRVALARTLATEPKLILFDEAFSNVDSILKSKIEKELVDIIKDSGISAIFVTHDSKEALSISDKIAYLEKGKIMQLSSACSIYNCPSSKSVGEFFGKANFIEKDDETYCIRPEECKINEECGEFKAHIGRVSYHGERQELELFFDHEDKEYKFIIYVDKNCDLKDKEYVRFDIDWGKASMISKECKI
jgi:iron(III) transport system ATP-binding protein